MMPAREDISDLRAGVRFWLFLNGVDSNAAMGICHYALAENAAMGICHYAFIHYICHYGLADNAAMGICHYAFMIISF